MIRIGLHAERVRHLPKKGFFRYKATYPGESSIDMICQTTLHLLREEEIKNNMCVIMSEQRLVHPVLVALVTHRARSSLKIDIGGRAIKRLGFFLSTHISFFYCPP